MVRKLSPRNVLVADGSAIRSGDSRRKKIARQHKRGCPAWTNLEIVCESCVAIREWEARLAEELIEVHIPGAARLTGFLTASGIRREKRNGSPGRLWAEAWVAHVAGYMRADSDLLRQAILRGVEDRDWRDALITVIDCAIEAETIAHTYAAPSQIVVDFVREGSTPSIKARAMKQHGS